MTRNPAYDILRVVAITLVAILHAWSMLDMDTPSYGMLYHFYRILVLPGVPLFVAISGALLLSEAPTPLPTFFRKRLSRVCIPFLIWGSFIYVVCIVAKQYTDIHSTKEAVQNYLPYLLENRINLSHWFVWMILALYLITPLLQRMLQAADGRQMVTYSLVVIVIILLLKHFYPSIYILRYTSPLLGNIGIYLAGYYAAPYLNRCVLSRLPMENIGTKIAVALSRYSYTIYLIHIPLIRAMIIFFHPATTAYMPILLGSIALLLSATFCYVCDRLLPRSVGRALGLS